MATLDTIRFASSAVLFCSLTLACGSSGATGAVDSCAPDTAKLAQIGDDCANDGLCASGLCDNNGYCAAPVAATGGGKCSTDKDCPSGDQCDKTTLRCFSPAKDNTGTRSCKTNADCASDESCAPNHTCQG